MEKEEFKKLAVDLIPVINDAQGILKENCMEGTFNIVCNADGYFDVRINGSDCYVNRLDRDSEVTFMTKEVLKTALNPWKKA